jgi:lipopolysaccharide export system protein LptC
MQGRSLDRIAAIVSLVLLTGLGLFTFYLSQVAGREQRPRATEPAPSTEPDYFVERLALLTMNEAGEPAFRIEARQLRHYPHDDTAEFEEPVMVSLDPQRPRVTITANSGRLLRGGVEAHLSGDVVVTRAATANAPPIVAETPFAIVLPEQDIVRTDRPVSVLRGGHRLTGEGMELNNRTRQLRVDSKVRAVIEPQPKPGAMPAEAGAPSAGAAR